MGEETSNTQDSQRGLRGKQCPQNRAGFQCKELRGILRKPPECICSGGRCGRVCGVEGGRAESLVRKLGLVWSRAHTQTRWDELLSPKGAWAPSGDYTGMKRVMNSSK